MLSTYIPLVGGTYLHPDKGVSGQLFRNLYPEDVNAGGKVQRLAMPSQGYKTWRTLTSNSANAIVRGLHFSSTGVNGTPTLYVALGNAVYRITQSTSLGGQFLCGQITEGTTPVHFVDNGFDLFVVDGTSAYYCSLSASNLTVNTTWRTATLPTLNGSPIKPSNVVFTRQRIIIDSGDNQFWYSDIASTTFDQLSFYSAETSADFIGAMGLVGENILILGRRSLEVWSMEGNPMQLIGGTPSQVGILAPASLGIIGDVGYFLGASDSGRFTVFAQGSNGSPVRISDEAIEAQISKLSQPSGARGFCFYDRGHSFYVLNFIADKLTLVFDASTKVWHIRSNVNADTGRAITWKPACIVAGYNDMLIAGSADSNELLEVSADIYTYGDQPIVREWITPIIWDDLGQIQVQSLQMDISAGTTTTMADDGKGNYNPVVMARFSKDGGYTYADQETRRLGKQGEYDQEPPVWFGLGLTRQLVAQFIISSALQFTIRGIKMKYNKTGAT